MEMHPGTTANWTYEEQMGHDNPRCTVATLRALDVEPTRLPLTGGGVRDQLIEAGRSTVHVDIHEANSGAIDARGGKMAPTLAQLLRHLDTDGRNYVICTVEHSMALVDGELIDTEHGGNRRRVEFCYEVL